MIRKYKYIHFIKIKERLKRSVWICLINDNGPEIGIIKWYPQWKKYCYFPHCMAVYSIICLKDIADFIDWLGKYRGKKEC